MEKHKHQKLMVTNEHQPESPYGKMHKGKSCFHIIKKKKNLNVNMDEKYVFRRRVEPILENWIENYFIKG